MNTEQETPEFYLNRQRRRRQGRIRREMAKTASKRGVTTLRNLETILNEEDDLAVYQRELIDHQNALVVSRIDLKFHRLYTAMGVSDETLRLSILANIPGQTQYDLVEVGQRKRAEMHPGKYKANSRLMLNLQRIQQKHRTYFAEDVDVWAELVSDKTILLEDLWVEYVRITQETVELLRLQVDWLKEKEPKVKGKPEVLVAGWEPEFTEIPEQADSLPEPFGLEGWSIFWTDKRWSIDPKHLVAIPTTQRAEALNRLEQIMAGEVMIKPNSILRALEFHLQKDIIQRAFATRLKYVPADMREWVKIKRGRSRILLTVP